MTEKILHLLDQGMTYGAIAQKLSITRNKVAGVVFRARNKKAYAADLAAKVERYQTDSAHRERILARQRKKYRERYHSDPDFRARRQSAARERYHASK